MDLCVGMIDPNVNLTDKRVANQRIELAGATMICDKFDSGLIKPVEVLTMLRGSLAHARIEGAA